MVARRTKKSCGDSCECNDCSKPHVEPAVVEQVITVAP